MMHGIGDNRRSAMPARESIPDNKRDTGKDEYSSQEEDKPGTGGHWRRKTKVGMTKQLEQH